MLKEIKNQEFAKTKELDKQNLIKLRQQLISATTFNGQEDINSIEGTVSDLKRK